LCNEIKRLSQDLGIRQYLSGIRIKQADISLMAELSLKVWLMDNNPRKVSLDDAISIYERALSEEGITVVT
jgi:alcohol dehydrogenase class IV